MAEQNNLSSGPVTLDIIKDELPKIQQNTGLENFSQNLDSRLTYIESQLKKSDLSPEERKIYEEYIQSALNLKEKGFNWTQETQNSLKNLLSQIQTLHSLYIETVLRNELQNNLKALESHEKLSIDNLDGRIDSLLSVVNLSWIEKIPVLKEKGKELLQYEPIIQWLAGASIIRALEQNGYSLYFKSNNTVQVVARDKNIKDEQAIQAKFNAYLAKSAVLPRVLQSGMLYVQPSFAEYRNAVLDASGNIIDPARTDIKSYVEFLRKKPSNELTPQEQVFLRTQQNFDQGLKFRELLKQNAEYQKLVGIVAASPGNEWIRSLLAQPNTPTQSPKTELDTSVPPSVPSTGAGMVGEWIWKLGGLIGKLAWAGAGGGIRVIGEVFSEATKHGGAWGALAVIGGLIFSIWKWGFWKTLGGLFAVWLADSASRGEISLPKTDKKPDTAEAPPQGVASWAIASAEASKPTEWTQEAPQKLDYTSLIATAMGIDNPHEATIDAEKAHISVLESASYDSLVAFYIDKKTDAGDKVKESLGYATLSAERKKKIDDLLNPDNKSWQEVIIKLLNYLQSQDTVKNMKPEDRQWKTLKQMIDAVVEGKNIPASAPAEWESTQWNVTPPPEVFTMSDGHSNLYLLSRLITQGYIPQLSDNTWAGAKDQSWYKKIWSGMTYFAWDGGPLTNNKDSKNPLVWAWHNGLQKKVGDFALAAAQDEKSMITQSLEAMKAKNIDSKALIEAELLQRQWRVDAIENALKKQPFDLKDLQKAMSDYEKSVKTKWEILWNKLGMKWWANWPRIFKSVDAGAYVRKAEWIVDSEKKKWLWDGKIWTIDEWRTFIDNQIRINGSYNINIDWISYDITWKTPDGRYTLVSNVDQTGHYFKIEEIIDSRNKQVIEWLRIEKMNEAVRLGEEIDAKKKTVLEKFTAWDAEKTSVEKQNAAMAALEDYNKRVIDANGKLSDSFALMTEAQAKELWKKLPKSGWLSEFIADNTKWTQFGWADKVDAWTAGTNYVKWARRGFVWVGLLSIAYNSGWWFTDLVKDGKIGTAMTRMLDLGIGMVPFLWAAHDILILNSKDYERWMLGADMSVEERNMRKAMVVLGIIPGVGIAVKWAGHVVKSGALLTVGGTVLKSGNMARSVAMYGMLGMSIVSTGFDIQEKLSK